MTKLGIEGDFLPFNSRPAVDAAISVGAPATINPYVNAGAIADASQLATATTVAGDSDELAGSIFSQIAAAQLAAMDTGDKAATPAETVPLTGSPPRLPTVPSGAGEDIYVDRSLSERTFISEAQTYTVVNIRHLLALAATLANGGVNPFTGTQVWPQPCNHLILSSATLGGFYDGSGRWFFEVGLPGKSGVGGGIIAAAPGIGAFASISPPLDPSVNSVRGQQAATEFVKRVPRWNTASGAR